jgi:hypothetical protein
MQREELGLVPTSSPNAEMYVKQLKHLLVGMKVRYEPSNCAPRVLEFPP